MGLGVYCPLAKDFYVVTPFVWGAESFDVGDDFPWQSLGLVGYHTHMLWKANKIAVGKGKERASPPAAPVAAASPDVSAAPDATPPQLDLATPIASTRTTSRRRGS